MTRFLTPLIFLAFSNLFMTFAWYGHLKTLKEKPIFTVILISWGIAFFEYCLQVPGNRLGSTVYTLPQLKIIQEIITMIVFAGFAVVYMKVPITRNFLYAAICMLGAAFFIFQDAT